MQFIPSRNTYSDIGETLGKGIGEGYQTRADELALQKSIGSLGPNASARQIIDAITKTHTYNPAAKKQLIESYVGAEKIDAAKAKYANKEVRKDLESNYIADGYPEYQAKLMADPLVEKSVKQAISLEHRDLKARGIRQPMVPERARPPIEQESAVPDAQQEIIEQVPQDIEEPKIPVEQEMKALKKEEWPQVPPPPETTPKERESWRSKNQTENNKLLKETKPKTNAHNKAILRLNHLNNLNDTHKLPEGVGSIVIDPHTGEPFALAQLAGRVNEETQDFVKTVNDFMIDAKNYFGARVTNFDVSAFKSRLPTLLNSESGRRLIIQQMKLMEELEVLHTKELENGLKHYGRNASYSDIQKVVDNKVEDREQELIGKMEVLLDAGKYLNNIATNPKYKDVQLMYKPDSNKFKGFLPGDIKKAEQAGYKKW